MTRLARSKSKRISSRAVAALDTTSIPILSTCWSQLHGTQNVQHGALKGQTWTDYFVFECPGCDLPFHYGAGLRLVGSHDPLDDLVPNDFQVLAFEIHCPRCPLNDTFKMGIDQAGVFQPPPRRPGGRRP